MTKRSECRCECHSNPLIIHFVPCCLPDDDQVAETCRELEALEPQCSCIANCNEVAQIGEGCRGLRKLDDVHAYRKAIADDCKIGACSMNNCHYPHCSPSARVLISLRIMRAEDEGRIMDGNPHSSMRGIMPLDRFKL